MVPNVAKTGSSFKGAALYYLHDKREAWEAERITAARVAWTSTRNMPTDNPELAWRIMAATAMDQDRLKAEAGVKATGRKSTASVYSYSLAWHPDEKKNLSRAEMLRAADESLKVIGATGRQALIVCHNDEPHPHVHVIVNRVSPEDGRMLSTSNDHVKLSQWAEAYERERGRIWCDQRVANNAKRASGDFVRASSPTPRSMEKAFDQARGADPVAAKRERDEAKVRAAKLAQAGANMSKRHRIEWDVLSRQHKDRKNEIFERAKAAGKRIRDAIGEQYRPQWQQLYRDQGRARRAFQERENRVLGKLKNVADALKASAAGEGEKRSFLAAGFNFLTSKKAREAAFMKEQERQKRLLKAAEREDVDHAMENLRKDRGKQLAGNTVRFGSERQALIDRQWSERNDLKGLWREESTRRNRSFDTIRRKAEVRQDAKATSTPDERAESAQRRDSFHAASQGRPRGRVRSRKRTRKGN